MTSLSLKSEMVRILLLGLVLMAGAGEVLATLGQTPSAAPAAAATSSAAPSAKMAAAAPLAQPGLYTLHEVVLENGTRVREYATAAGLVFAVAWDGPVLPDLSALLGGYFNTFKRETEQSRLVGRRGSPVSMDRDGLVVSSSGRMRNFFGHAYAPALIPAGVNVKDVLQ